MVRNISSCTKVLVLPVVLWVVSSFSLRAQEKDFATWANVGFEYKLKPALTVSGALEWRTKMIWGNRPMGAEGRRKLQAVVLLEARGRI